MLVMSVGARIRGFDVLAPATSCFDVLGSRGVCRVVGGNVDEIAVFGAHHVAHLRMVDRVSEEARQQKCAECDRSQDLARCSVALGHRRLAWCNTPYEFEPHERAVSMLRVARAQSLHARPARLFADTGDIVAVCALLSSPM